MDQKPEIIIKEIPVLVSKSMTEKLRLLQYPLRPAEETLKECNIIQTRIKPGQNKMQLKWELDTSSRNYDKSKGESLVTRAIDPNSEEGEVVKKLDSVMLESCQSSQGSKPPRYVIGVLKDGQLHISALKHILQLKPNLPYFDKASQDVASEQGNDTEDDAEEEATKVTVKFTRGTRDPNAKGKNSRNYFTVRKQEEEEPWVDLKYNHSDPSEFNNLYSKNPDSESPFYVLSPKSYLSLLIPKYKPTPYPSAAAGKNRGQARVSIAQLQSMPLSDQLKILMLNGKVLHYSQIVEFLKLKLKVVVDDTTLLRAIQNVAILVQGCWVVKSELVYESNFISSSNGIGARLMQSARDLVLSQFTENRIVERKKIGLLTRLPHDEVTEILNQVSQMVPRKGWEFILPYDGEFINKYPHVVERQLLTWNMKKEQKSRRNSDKDSNNSTSGGPLKPPVRSPPRRRSRNKSHSSDNDSGAESDHRRGGRQRRNSARSDISGIPSRVET